MIQSLEHVCLLMLKNSLRMAIKILGISAYYHDSAAALLVDGAIVAAVQEERFTRVKHDANFPSVILTHMEQKCITKSSMI